MNWRGKQEAAEAAVADHRRKLEQTVDAGIKRAHAASVKPTLRRYSWSRLHVDLLDDMRWSLVAKRASAPLPLVEAMLIRLENHANKSRPRGFVGDFSTEGLAARWNVDDDMIARIYAQLEAADIGWIDQDQIVTFWDRNPDVVDETAAERNKRMRDRKKGMKLLAAAAAQGLITAQQRGEREAALLESRTPGELILDWGLSTGPLRRNTVTVTTRADQTNKTRSDEKEKSGLQGEGLGAGFFPGNAVDAVDFGKAQLWLETEGVKLVTARMMVQPPRAVQFIERWITGLDGDLGALVPIIMGAMGTKTIGSSFQTVIENQIARNREEATKGPRLPHPPVAAKGRG